MIYGSVCSGIEAATVAWHPLGWKPSFFSEIEKFPREVLAHHHPDVPLHGDFTTITGHEYEPIDLLVGGTPCQSFSIAGLRKGLDDPRGNLMLEFGALARRTRARWLVWENVPGVLSSNGGRDFGTFLGMLAELGYGFAYRVLDAQYFGVAQRRRRVFVVGCFGDWRSAAAVLFERDSLCGNPAPSREARQAVAGTISSRTQGGGGLGTDFECNGGLQPIITMAHGQGGAEIGFDRGPTLTCNHEAPIAAYAIPGNVIGRQPENGGNGLGADDSGVMYTLTKTDIHAVAHAVEPMHDVAPCLTKTDQHGVAHASTMSTDQDQSAAHCYNPDQPQVWRVYSTQRVSPCLQAGESRGNAIMQSMTVRRLTPTECERLQGFPDGYTKISDKTPDGPRYKALGNSMAVPVMRWIGERIQMVEDIKK